MRFEDLVTDAQRRQWTELTGKAGTAVVFTHDLLHHSWHETDTYRRVVHLTYSHGDTAAEIASRGPEKDAVYTRLAADSDDEFLRYVLRGPGGADGQQGLPPSAPAAAATAKL